MVVAVAEEKAVEVEEEEEAEVVGLLSRIGVEEFERPGGAAAIMMPDDRSAGMGHRRMCIYNCEECYSSRFRGITE